MATTDILGSSHQPVEKVKPTLSLASPHQHHRDIVAPAILIGHVYQVPSRLIEGGLLPKGGGNTRVLNHIGQTV